VARRLRRPVRTCTQVAQRRRKLAGRAAVVSCPPGRRTPWPDEHSTGPHLLQGCVVLHHAQHGTSELVPVRLDPALRAALDERAARDATIVSDVIRKALRCYIDAAYLRPVHAWARTEDRGYQA
jgi:hypothetical protein